MAIFKLSSFLRYMFRKILIKTRLVIFKLWEKLYNPRICPADNCEIDVLVTVIEKDLQVLPLCIAGIKRNIAHPIKNIYLVAPENKIIQNFAAEQGLLFINENTIFGYPPNKIKYTIFSGLDRSGWIFQQLIKLSGKVGTCRYFVSIDADHILLKPHVFLSKGRTVFYQSFDYNVPYYNNIKRLLGYYPFHWFSYVSHKMLFDKVVLVNMHRQIEKRKGESWDQAIIHNLKTTEHSDFSEFELYGHFIDKRQKIHVPWREKPLHVKNLANLESLQKKFSNKMSISFSSYISTL